MNYLWDPLIRNRCWTRCDVRWSNTLVTWLNISATPSFVCISRMSDPVSNCNIVSIRPTVSSKGIEWHILRYWNDYCADSGNIKSSIGKTLYSSWRQWWDSWALNTGNIQYTLNLRYWNGNMLQTVVLEWDYLVLTCPTDKMLVASFESSYNRWWRNSFTSIKSFRNSPRV